MTGWHDGRRRLVGAASAAAQALGLRPGLPLAQAMALVPGLTVMEAAPAEDAAALRRLALWCHRLTPLVGLDGADGLWLDVAGASHLWGGEAAMLRRLVRRLARDGIETRAAVADTPGAAHAVARHGADPALEHDDRRRNRHRSESCSQMKGQSGMAERERSHHALVVPPGDQAAALAPLPVHALRLAPETEATLRRLGFERIGALARIPRALLARRFGPLPVLRLDQAMGRVAEPLVPLAPEPAWERRAAFLEPLLTAEALSLAVGHLVDPLCAALEAEGLGVRQMDLVFERVDGSVTALRAGTARPSRDAAHLARMLRERLETIDPEPGVEAMRLCAPLTETLRWEQQAAGEAGCDGGVAVARLVDRLENRLGPGRVYRMEPVESDIPERALRRQPALAPPPPTAPAAPPQAGGHAPLHGMDPPTANDPPLHRWKPKWEKPPCRPATLAWPRRLQAPARLLHPPRPVQAIAALPDAPPVAFTWRAHRFKVRRADGPERIHGEWWHGADEAEAVRDYYQVEDESGRRFWLFRRGDGVDGRTGDLRWFLQGVF